MRIASVRHLLPSRRVGNEDVLEEIRRANSHLDAAQRAHIERAVSFFLRGAGTENRFKLGDGETAFDLAVRSCRMALADAQVDPGDVDFVIYAGVARGWIEPSSAAAFQAALGLPNATAFDILDACAGWLRALQVADSFFRSRTYRRGLVINCECGLARQYDRWVLDDAAALHHQLATYTIGEAAAATVLVADDSAPECEIVFRTFGEHFDLCLLPLGGFADFSRPEIDQRVHAGRFFALSGPLLETTARKILELFAAHPRIRSGRFDICFGHSASEKVSRALARELGFEDILFSTHREYGNTVSASIPLAMSVAREQGRLRRGDRVLVVVGSAGITVGLATFTY